MRALIVMLMILGAMVFLGNCDSGDDSGSDTTEVAWKNSTSSDGKIEDIVWNNDTTWNSGGSGYALGATTESKNVSTNEGTVECRVYDTAAGDYTAAQITAQGNSSTALALTLDDGSQTITLEAHDSGTVSVK